MPEWFKYSTGEVGLRWLYLATASDKAAATAELLP